MLQYDAPNRKNNSTIAKAELIRVALRKLGVQAGDLSVNPTVNGAAGAQTIPESEFADLEFTRDEPLNLSVAISGWGKDTDAEVAGIARQLAFNGAYNGLRILLAGWGCPYPDAHVSNIPSVREAVRVAMDALVVGIVVPAKPPAE